MEKENVRMGKGNRIFVMPVILLLAVFFATNLFSEQVDTGNPSLKPSNPQQDDNHHSISVGSGENMHRLSKSKRKTTAGGAASLGCGSNTSITNLESKHSALANSSTQFSVVEHLMTYISKDEFYGEYAGCMTPPEKTTFLDTDSFAALWFYYQNATVGDTIKREWYAPDETLYTTSNTTNPYVNGCGYGAIYIKGYSASSKLGQWQVKVYRNDELIFTENFTIQKDTSVQFSVAEHTMTYLSYDELLDQYSNGETPPEKTTFLDTDSLAMQWFSYQNALVGDTVKWEWYAPDETLYWTANDTYPYVDGWWCYGIYIKGYSAASKLGQWQVKVYRNDELLFTENFTIQKGTSTPTPTATSTPTPEATVTLPPVPSPEASVTLPPLPSPEISPTPTETATPTPEATPTSTPTSSTTIPQIAAGYHYSLALKSDGTVWAWGNNDKGQLGDGTTEDRSTPVQVSGLSNVTAIACGGAHSLALKSDGTVWAWGNNNYGQLGDGTKEDRDNPVQVSSLSGVAAIACGTSHSLALKSDGTVWAWGYNENGQLGDGTTKNRSTPVRVKGLKGVTAIAAGWLHSLALKSNGTVWAWGQSAQLGNGATTGESISTPVQVSDLSGITAITAGIIHSLVVKSNDRVWAWGNNQYGQLGDGTTTLGTTPVQVSNIRHTTAIAAGQIHSLALKSDGKAWAWGDNSSGQLGDGTTTKRKTPVQVSGLSDVTAIAGGSQHSLALKPDGTVWAWGYNSYGQLGDGTTTYSTTPVQVDINLGQPEENLLEKYAPILYMHGQERFHPTDVQVMLDNSKLMKTNAGNDKVVYKNEDNTLTLEMLVKKTYNTKKHYLKLKNDAEDVAKDKDIYWYWTKEQTVYGREFTSEEDKAKTVLQYWFFYVYNDWGTSEEMGNSHQGDWEMIQIILNNSKQPEEISYGFHHGGQTFEWDNEEVKKSDDGNHPLVYVTLGGHGCWNKSGSHAWYQEMKKFGCQECVDETADDGDVLYPNTLSENEVQASSEKYSYELVNLSDISSRHWIYWKGYWGNQTEEKKVVDVGSSGPPSPSYIDYISKKSNYPRWKFPIKWAKSPHPSSYTVCTSDNSNVIPLNLKGTSVSYNEYCSTDSDKCGKDCSSIKIYYSEKDLVFDVYSLDGNEVDLKVSRYKRTGEVYDVEFEGLEIPRNGKASFAFSPEENPTFEIGIDRDRNDIIDSHRLPDFLEVK